MGILRQSKFNAIYWVTSQHFGEKARAWFEMGTNNNRFDKGPETIKYPNY